MSQHQEKVRLWFSSVAWGSLVGLSSGLGETSCFFLLQGGRGDLPEHHGAQRYPAGCQRAPGLSEVPQAAAGGGAGNGKQAWLLSVWHRFLGESGGTPVKNTDRHSLPTCFPLIILCHSLCSTLAFCHKKAVFLSVQDASVLPGLIPPISESFLGRFLRQGLGPTQAPTGRQLRRAQS